MQKFMLAAFFSAVTIISLCHCSDSNSGISDTISAIVSKGDSVTLSLSELYPEEWDMVYIFAPYSSPSSIRKELGFHWISASATSIEALDDISLLVFTSGKHVVTHCEHPRQLGDFAGLSEGSPYSREEAVFVVNVDKSGWPEVIQSPVTED